MQTTMFVTNPLTTVVEIWDAVSPDDLIQKLCQAWDISCIEITFNGENILECGLGNLQGSILDVRLSVLGGKGGYGSLLRIAAAQKKHFNNFDSSRDAMGRRLRDIKNEHRLIQFIKKKQQEQEMLDKEKHLLAELKQQQQMQRPSSREVAALAIEESYSRQIQNREGTLRNMVARAYLAKRTPKTSEEDEQKILDMEIMRSESNPNKTLHRLIHRRTGRGAPKLELGQPSSSAAANSDVQERGDLASSQKAKVTNNKQMLSSAETPKNIYNLARPGLTSTSAVPKEVSYPPLELATLSNFADVLKLEPEHVKHELRRLGLKCGGKPDDRAKRLWDIKVDPSCLLDYRYLAKN